MAAIQSLLQELKQGLHQIYGQRLRSVHLYGSYARGQQDSESDVDVLIVLDLVEHYAAEIERTSALVSQVSLRYGVSTSRVFTSEAEWLQPPNSFMEAIRREAVPA